MVYTARRTYTDEVVGSTLGSTLDNSEMQAIQLRQERFVNFESSHLFASDGYLSRPILSHPSVRRLTLKRELPYTRYFDTDLGMWEIPSDLSIDFTELTAGIAYNYYDYLYLELYRTITTGEIGFRLNIYANNSTPNTGTTPDVTTSTKNLTTEEDHVIFPLAKVYRYQTTQTPETDISNITDISVAAQANFGEPVRCNNPEILSLLLTKEYQYCYDFAVLPDYNNINQWTKVTAGSNATAAVNSGVLTITDPDNSSSLYYKREAANVAAGDVVIFTTSMKIDSGTLALIVGAISDNVKMAIVYADSLGLYYKNSAGTNVSLGTFDTSQYHKVTIVKDAENNAYFYVDDILRAKVAYSSLYSGSGTQYIFFGSSSTTNIVTASYQYVRYSLIKEAIGTNNYANRAVNSPEIASLLSTYQYQYTYDWSALPAASFPAWVKVGAGTEAISDGILSISDTSGNYLYYNIADDILANSDIIIFENRCKLTSNSTGVSSTIIGQIDTGSGNNRVVLAGDTLGNLYLYSTVIAKVDFSVQNTFRIEKIRDSRVNIYVNNLLIYTGTTMAASVDNWINFGLGSTAPVGSLDSEYIRFSIIKEGSRNIIGHSAQIDNINIDGNSVISTNTNGDINWTPNGTGKNVIANARVKCENNTTANRPATPATGQMFYDTTLGKPIWYSGAAWKDAAGTTV